MSKKLSESFTNFVYREQFKKSKLRDETQIDDELRLKGDEVIYLNAKGEHKGIIKGFYEVSALVIDSSSREVTCVNFKNLIDPETDKRFTTAKKKYGKFGMRLTPTIER